MLAGEERPERGERPEEWLVELLEELRSEEAEAWFRQIDREVRLPVVIRQHGGQGPAIPSRELRVVLIGDDASLSKTLGRSAAALESMSGGRRRCTSSRPLSPRTRAMDIKARWGARDSGAAVMVTVRT